MSKTKGFLLAASVVLAMAVLVLAADEHGQTSTHTCGTCNGTGRIVVANPCTVCGGRGHTEFMGVRMPCFTCGQTGKFSIPCTACNGTGKITVSQAEAAFQRGNAAFNQKNWDRAITEYTECIKLNPSADGAYNNRGLAYQNKGDTARANADFETARRISSAASVTPNYVPPPAQNNSPSSGGGGGSGGGVSGGNSITNMVLNYQNMGKNVEMALNNYRNAVSRGSSKYELESLYNNILNIQQRMRQYREECNRQGASIGADYYETVRP